MNICNIRTTRIENKINYTHADLYRINYSMYEKSTDINLKKKKYRSETCAGFEETFLNKANTDDATK